MTSFLILIMTSIHAFRIQILVSLLGRMEQAIMPGPSVVQTLGCMAFLLYPNNSDLIGAYAYAYAYAYTLDL